MSKPRSIYKRAKTRRGVFVGVLGILLVVLLVAAACGDDDTPTPVPPTATPRPQATATPTGPRPISEWTCDEPATLEEIEAALEAHRGNDFTFISWGGSYQGMQRGAILDPFREEFGVIIHEESSDDYYAQMRAQVETGNTIWHVFDASGQSGISFGLDGFLEELDCAIIGNAVAGFPPQYENAPWAAGAGVSFSVVFAYNTDTYPEGSEPDDWGDFIDEENFPGRRGWWSPGFAWKHILRTALLAENPDLVKTQEGRDTVFTMTPEKIDHAYELLDEVWEPLIDVWYSGISDCPSLISSGDLDMCSIDSGITGESIAQGLPIAFCWTCGHTMQTEPWFVPRGTKAQDPERFELVQLFLAWSAFPVNNARLPLFTAYGPINLEAGPFLEGPEYDEVRPSLSTSPANLPYMVALDEYNDGQIGGAQADRWVTWQQQVK